MGHHGQGALQFTGVAREVGQVVGKKEVYPMTLLKLLSNRGMLLCGCVSVPRPGRVARLSRNGA